jgi:hypothetical protein
LQRSLNKIQSNFGGGSAGDVCATLRRQGSNVQELYKQCKGGSFGEVFCLEFVSRVARQVFTNGLALKDIKDPPDLMTMSIPSACPKSFVSNDAMVEAFSEWANQHIEKWSASAQIGVIQAMRDTWPCS